MHHKSTICVFLIQIDRANRSSIWKLHNSPAIVCISTTNSSKRTIFQEHYNIVQMTDVINVWISLRILRISRVSAEHTVHGSPTHSDAMKDSLSSLTGSDLQIAS
ncbi:hypothetical protein GQ42DRAFT_53007 [Ramicandelaber brevisporus]|nr:hypothetical protein GQ42DRAFT_53007 [Ramicandelaber brevisporus]